jgi:hypothetical protein
MILLMIVGQIWSISFGLDELDSYPDELSLSINAIPSNLAL